MGAVFGGKWLVIVIETYVCGVPWLEVGKRWMLEKRKKTVVEKYILVCVSRVYGCSVCDWSDGGIGGCDYVVVAVVVMVVVGGDSD